MRTLSSCSLFGGAVSLILTSAVQAAFTAQDLMPTTLAPGGAQLLYANGQAAGASSAPGTQGGFASAGTGLNPPDHALLWSGSAASYVDMNPAGAASSDIYAVTATVQVGQVTTGTTQKGGYWTGSANSFIPLPSTGFIAPEAHGAADTAGGTVIVGYDNTNLRAILWTKSGPTTYAATNLHTSLAAIGSYDSSFARATDGVTVAGQAFTTATATAGHAIVWNVGTHAATDINGAFNNSDARGVSGNEVAGYADNGDLSHAILWNFDGSTYNPDDLNPAGASTSQAYATNGVDVAGFAVVDDSGNSHAFVWVPGVGGSHTPIDLQSTLGSNFVSSFAEGLDANGDVVGFATDSGGDNHAILWTVSAPEPASAGVLGVGALMLMRRRKSARIFGSANVG